MKRFYTLCAGLLAAVLLTASAGLQAAQSGQTATSKPGKLVRVTEKEANWAASARKSYPLDVCVVSDEKLGSMGDSPEYIYRVEGQPDRLVIFCCEGCEEDFNADPAAHLAKLDGAKSKKPAPEKPGKGTSSHQKH
jgi:hypothetical protein